MINTKDLAPYAEVDLDVMAADAPRMRTGSPIVFTDLKRGEGVDAIVALPRENGRL